MLSFKYITLFTNNRTFNVCIFNYSLHFVEIKAVLEGRGFQPNFLVKLIVYEPIQEVIIEWKE